MSFVFTYKTQDKHTCPRRDSIPQSHQANGRRPSPYTARPLGSARTRDLPACSAVLQPTAPPPAPLLIIIYNFICMWIYLRKKSEAFETSWVRIVWCSRQWKKSCFLLVLCYRVIFFLFHADGRDWWLFKYRTPRLFFPFVPGYNIKTLKLKGVPTQRT